MYKKIRSLCILCVCMLFFHALPAGACSNYIIQTNNGITTHTYWTRTMDLLFDSTKLGIGFRTIQQGETLNHVDPSTVHASWTAKYAATGAGLEVDAHNLMSDGVNSAGLSGGMFWLNSATYDAQKGKVGHDDFVTYVLTNYASVEKIAADAVSGQLNLAKGRLGINSLHYTFTDKTGRTIVIEPITKDGKFTMSMYTNYESSALNSAGWDPNKYKISINVMTNSPTYDEMIALYNSGKIEKTGTSGPARFYRLAENKQNAHDLESYAGVAMKIYTPFGMDSVDSHTQWNTRYNPIYDVQTDSVSGVVKSVVAYIKPGDSALTTKYAIDLAHPSDLKSLLRSFDASNVGVDAHDATISYWIIGDYKRGLYFNDGLSTPADYSNQTTSSLANHPAYKDYIIHTNPTKEYGYSLGGVGYFRNDVLSSTYNVNATKISSNASTMKEGFALAGAILNDGANINFNNNVVLDKNLASGMMSYGGAIFNNYYLAHTAKEQGKLTFAGTADFVDNKAGAATSYLSAPYPVFSALGGAVFNYAGEINFNNASRFDQNSAQGCFYATGGAIANSSINILGKNLYRAVLNFNANTSFTGNSATSIPYLTNPQQGYGNAHGGAIYNFNGHLNFGKTVDINVHFANNSVHATEYSHGGAISNTEQGNLVVNGQGTFIDNSAITSSPHGIAYGGAIYNSNSTTTLNARTGDIVFEKNAATSAGGAIYNANKGTINLNADAGHAITFVTATDTLESAQVYAYKYPGDERIYYSLSSSVTESDYVYLSPECVGKTKMATETLKGKETGYYVGNINVNHGTDGSVVLNGAKNTLGTLDIRGGDMAINSQLTVIKNVAIQNAQLALNPLNSGVASLSNGIKGQGLLIKNGDGVLVLGGDSSGFTGDFNFNAGAVNLLKNARYFNAANTNIADNTAFNMANGAINHIDFGSLSLNGVMRLSADVDLSNLLADTIAANSLNGNGNILISNISYAGIPTATSSSIAFANSALKGSVALAPGLHEMKTPIFNYGVSYNPAKGSLNYQATGFNPSILAAPVAAQAGGYLTQLSRYEQAFNNMDLTMLRNKEQRAVSNYASGEPAQEPAAGQATFRQNPEAELWVKPYAAFETVGLASGPEVRNTAYGALFGADSPLVAMGNGWDAVYSLYAGYNDSQQTYDEVDIRQNGVTLGVTGFFYNDGFFAGLTANVGCNFADAETGFGDENFTMLTTGLAAKTGYNWELADGKLIIQPNYLMSYTLVNTFNYDNAAGVQVNSDPLHAIQIAPGIKLIGNLENNWQPYASVQMVWNILDETKFTANDVALPELAVDPYVQYGVGVQKSWGEQCTLFGQAMMMSGGRDSLALQFGLRWTLDW